MHAWWRSSDPGVNRFEDNVLVEGGHHFSFSMEHAGLLFKIPSVVEDLHFQLEKQDQKLNKVMDWCT
jgi:hypothetical protein